MGLPFSGGNLKRNSLESSFEIAARVIGNNYGVRVVFEGDEASTDGNLIRLPGFSELSEENQEDLNGYLDHEVGHVKFTDFESWRRIEHSFHRTLANLAEDVRIENRMGETYAGARRHLKRLREKIEQSQDARWPTIDLLFRFGGAMQRQLQEKSYPEDLEIEPLLHICRDEINDLKGADSTEEVRRLTWSIILKLKAAFDDPNPPEGENPQDAESQAPAGGDKDESSRRDKMSPKPDRGESGGASEKEPGQEDGSSEQKGMTQSDGDPGESSSHSDPSSGADEESPSERGGYAADPNNGDAKENESDWDAVRSRAGRMLEGGEEAEEAENSFGGDLGKVMREVFRDWLQKEIERFQGVPPNESKARRLISDGETLSFPFLAASRRFDVEKRLSGDSDGYKRLRVETRNARTKLILELQRTLFSISEAEWKTEREEGEIDPQLLAGIPTGNRNIFREFHPGKSMEVAMSLLVDCSSSMESTMSEQKKALCAMAESLRVLAVPVEIIGFRSLDDAAFRGFSGNLTFPERFNRTRLRIEYEIAKEFHGVKLEGIEGLRADGGTPLNEAVAWAGRRLDQQRASRKILMVFTDGEPCGCGDPRVLRNDLIAQIRKLERVGIEVIAFAIRCPTVGRFFSRTININRITELEGAGLSEIRRLLLVESEAARGNSKPKRNGPGTASTKKGRL